LLFAFLIAASLTMAAQEPDQRPDSRDKKVQKAKRKKPRPLKRARP